jgi:hypothetical protein
MNKSPNYKCDKKIDDKRQNKIIVKIEELKYLLFN